MHVLKGEKHFFYYLNDLHICGRCLIRPLIERLEYVRRVHSKLFYTLHEEKVIWAHEEVFQADDTRMIKADKVLHMDHVDLSFFL